MNDNAYGREIPVAAFATVPGNSALTLIRCSGKGSLEFAASVFSTPQKLLQAGGNTVVHGWIVGVGSGKKIDEVLISVFRGPKSYTGEDGLDISCHGGTTAGKAVLQTLIAAGFKDALPGEFTFRAFMNGKLDLTRCESVMELVSAKTDRSRSHAVNRLSGVLAKEIDDIKKTLVSVLSGAELFLDYSEDEISIDPDEAAGKLPGRETITETIARLKKLVDSWQTERIYQEGVFTVIAGRPNAGKSSLFNLLLKEERSIVTEIPGTTRDWIEAWISVDGIPLRLADTAGLRESGDYVEKIGVERSRELLEEAELVLYLIDGKEGVTADDMAFIGEFRQRAKGTLLVVWNKADVAGLSKLGNIINISAKTGEGIAELIKTITTAILGKGSAAMPQWGMGNGGQAKATLGTVRQKNLVEAAAAALDEALRLSAADKPLDIIAPLLREAVNSLGEITGEVSTADILEEMFSKFCVGK